MRKTVHLMLAVTLAVYFFSLVKSLGTADRKSGLVTQIAEPTKAKEKIYPIAEFEKRITKKPFGIYITPQSSPIQPERFAGFHTGVDVEYGDVADEVPVVAVCNGDVVMAKWASGYGGVMVQRCQENFVVYGHLRLSSMTKKTKVVRGEPIAVLGEGGTIETDYERKHLHFGIHRGSIDLRGYVQREEKLGGWIDPLTEY